MFQAELQWPILFSEEWIRKLQGQECAIIHGSASCPWELALLNGSGAIPFAVQLLKVKGAPSI